MSRIQILDEKKYPLPMMNKDNLPYYRWEHRVTLSYKGKRYMAFIDNGIRERDKIITFPKAYIEEITTGNLEYIKDEDLVFELHRFLEALNFLEIQMPIRKDYKKGL
jgi:hypothetical protein